MAGPDTPDQDGETVFVPSRSPLGTPSPTPAGDVGRVSIGDVLNGIYEVKRLIRRGGMGEVYEGVNIASDERVAIKVMLPTLAADPKVQAMFRKEARTLTRLAHPALVQYRVLAQEPRLNVLYIVTEFVDGVELSDVLGQIEPSSSVLKGLMRRLAEGLRAAHELGAVHRDISPDNVLLPDRRLDQAKIIDFGIAKDLDPSKATIIGDGFAGKLGYVAPEQFGDFGRDIGPWTDVYSLGLVILAVASGKDVDMGSTLVEAVDKRRAGVDVNEAPEDLRAILARMLAADPAKRTRSMDEVLAMIDERPRTLPPTEAPSTPVQPRTEPVIAEIPPPEPEASPSVVDGPAPVAAAPAETKTGPAPAPKPPRTPELTVLSAAAVESPAPPTSPAQDTATANTTPEPAQPAGASPSTWTPPERPIETLEPRPTVAAATAPAPPEPPPRAGKAALLAAGGVAVLLIGGAIWWFMPKEQPAPVVTAPAKPSAASSSTTMATAAGPRLASLTNTPCSWLNVSQTGGALALSGVAGAPDRARDAVAAAAKTAGLTLSSGVDIGNVQSVSQDLCATLDAFRPFKSPNANALATDHAAYVITRQGRGKYAGAPTITVAPRDPAKDFAVLAVATSGALSMVYPSRQAFEAARADKSASINDLGGDAYQVQNPAFNLPGRPGVLLLTGQGPFDPSLLTRPAAQRDGDWASSLHRAAAAGGWQASMIWYGVRANNVQHQTGDRSASYDGHLGEDATSTAGAPAESQKAPLFQRVFGASPANPDTSH